MSMNMFGHEEPMMCHVISYVLVMIPSNDPLSVIGRRFDVHLKIVRALFIYITRSIRKICSWENIIYTCINTNNCKCK